MSNVVIVKFGGAAITEKHAIETLRPRALQSACMAIDAACRHHKVVVCHGAGSFGHHHAKDFAINSGGVSGASAAETMRGFAMTRHSVQTLNRNVVDTLLTAGLPATSLSPCGAWTCDGGSLVQDEAGIAAVRAVLAAGLLPVLHGDAVLDKTLGCTILSGDLIMRRLAEELQPAWVVFLTDVAGIYDKPPAEPGAQLLAEVVVTPEGSMLGADVDGLTGGGLLRVESSTASNDTTGGMAAKVAEAAAIARLGIPVVIAAVGSEAAHVACTQGPGQGSRIAGCTVVRCKRKG